MRTAASVAAEARRRGVGSPQCSLEVKPEIQVGLQPCILFLPDARDRLWWAARKDLHRQQIFELHTYLNVSDEQKIHHSNGRIRRRNHQAHVFSRVYGAFGSQSDEIVNSFTTCQLLDNANRRYRLRGSVPLILRHVEKEYIASAHILRASAT